MKKLLDKIQESGWKGKVVPVSHLTDLRDAILKRFERGLIDKDLYTDQLKFFSFDPPAGLPDARSIIIVAVPTPQMRITFRWMGSSVPVIIPPTYVNYTSRTDDTLAVLKNWLSQEGYRLVKSALPLKTLAAGAGLAKYGRNNICYIPGMGSFLQLAAAFSDLPCDNDPWGEPEILARCRSCTACLKNCPTKAIGKDRFLLFAEKCLTYFNESANDIPPWIDPSSHNCIIGCMRCQAVCPENRLGINLVEDRCEFSEKETMLFLQNLPLNRFPAESVLKINSLQISENFNLLCRNLGLLLEGDVD